LKATHLQPAAKPAGDPDRIALAVAGDDAKAKSTAMALIDEIGFEAVDAGSIAESWRQQPGSPCYLKDYDVKGVREALAEATPERKPEWRATPNSPGTYDAQHRVSSFAMYQVAGSEARYPERIAES